jgi:primosomal protein N' (replication factor Y)
MPILRLAIPTPLRSLVDYLPPAGLTAVEISALQPGCRLLVNFGRRVLQAYLIEVAAE